MKSNEGLRLGWSVDRFLHAMHRYDSGRTLPLLHKATLTTPQIAALEFADEPRTISGIASYLGLSRPASSQLIDKLVRNQLVCRVEGVRDRRERTILLTAKGRALVNRIAAARAARFDAALAALPADIAARLNSLLEEVVGALLQTRPQDGARPFTVRSRER